MGDAGAPAPVEEAQSAVDAVAVKAPEGCTTTGTVPTKALDTLTKLTKQVVEAKCNVLRETIRARNTRIEELSRIIQGCSSEMEGGKIMTKIRALDARNTAELVCLDATHDCTCN